MSNGDKSYLEIKVTFIHILVLLVAIILIGIFLFSLGYKAGKSSMKDPIKSSKLAENFQNPEEIKIVKEKPVKTNDKKKSGIIEEEKMFNQKSLKKTTPKKEQIKGKTIKREPYYSIQVGAFSLFYNAKKYSEKFGKLGFQTEILSTIKNNKKLFRVRVGNFKNIQDAKREKQKLENMEKKKFTIERSD
jgi:cell division protein FtsN